MSRSPINPGEVVWSGENPVVSLIAGTESSTCFLAFSETWLTLPR